MKTTGMILLASFVAITVYGQADPLRAANDDVQKKNQETRVAPALEDATLDANFSGARHGVKIEASKDEKNGTILLSKKISTKFSSNLKLSAPLSESTGEASPASLHGLAGTAKAELALNFQPTQPSFVIRDRDLWTRSCAEKGLKKGCDPFELDPSIIDRVVALRGFTTMATASAEYARTKFDFADPASLAARSDSEPQYSGTAGFGLFPRAGGLYFVGATWTYESSYEGQKKRQICTPLSSGAAGTECRTTSLGAPDHQRKRIIGLQTRWFRGQDLVADIRASREIGEGTTGIEIPLYFMRKKDTIGPAGFNGGIVLGWRSDTKEFTASAFVGALGELLQ